MKGVLEFLWIWELVFGTLWIRIGRWREWGIESFWKLGDRFTWGWGIWGFKDWEIGYLGNGRLWDWNIERLEIGKWGIWGIGVPRRLPCGGQKKNQ